MPRSFLIPLLGIFLLAGNALAQPAPPTATSAAPPTLVQQAVQEAITKMMPTTPAGSKRTVSPGAPADQVTTAPTEAPGVLDMTSSSEAPAGTGDFVPSYGSWERSLMFSSKSIETLKKILLMVEQHREPGTESVDTGDDLLGDLMNSMEKDGIPKPSLPPPYPVFRLNSILLEPTGGWSILLNKQKWTQSGDNSMGELQILSVNRSTASFLWRPENALLAGQLRKDINRLKTAQGDPIVPNPNRVATYIPPANMDPGQEPLPVDPKAAPDPNQPEPQRASVRFTLRPNQTFAPQYMAIYEGFAPNAPPAPAASTGAASPLEPIPAEATIPAPQANVADQRIGSAAETLKQMNALAAQNAARLNGTAPAPAIPPTETPARPLSAQ